MACSISTAFNSSSPDSPRSSHSRFSPAVHRASGSVSSSNSITLHDDPEFATRHPHFHDALRLAQDLPTPCKRPLYETGFADDQAFSASFTTSSRMASDFMPMTVALAPA